MAIFGLGLGSFWLGRTKHFDPDFRRVRYRSKHWLLSSLQSSIWNKNFRLGGIKTLDKNLGSSWSLLNTNCIVYFGNESLGVVRIGLQRLGCVSQKLSFARVWVEGSRHDVG